MLLFNEGTDKYMPLESTQADRCYTVSAVAFF